MNDEPHPEETWNDAPGSVSRRSFLAGTGALSLAMAADWESNVRSSDDGFADAALCRGPHEELEPGMRATGIWPEACD